MWGGGAQCVHGSLPRGAHSQPAPTLSGAISARRPPRPTPPSPTLIAKIDSSVACLWILTPLSAGTAVAAVLIAVSTNNWLHTEENIMNPSYNGTGKYGLVVKQTVSGLWRICHTDRINKKIGKAIPEAKLIDLKSLLYLIPKDAQNFYQKLIGSEQMEDDIEGFSGEIDFVMEVDEEVQEKELKL